MPKKKKVHRKRLLNSKHVFVQDDKGSVDVKDVDVSRSAEEVVWHSFANKSAVIIFASPDGSPFQDDSFHVPAGGSVSSGKPKAPAGATNYKYIVVGHAGSNDPGVIIKP